MAAAVINFYLSKCILAFAILSLCHAHHIEKHPARVLIREDRSAEDSFTIDIESNGNLRKLKVTPVDNVWAEGAKLYTWKLDKSGKHYADPADIPEDIKVYHDSQTGAFLSIKDGNINGILDSEFTIESEKGNHYMVKSSTKHFKKYDTLPVPDNLPATLIREKLIKEGEDDATEVPNNLKNIDNRVVTYTAEVIIFVDSLLATALGTDSQIYNYLTIFWNAVNARYKTITSPKIIIRLVGVVISRTTASEPYITSNIISGKKINGDNTLDSFATYVAQHLKTIPPHDLAYLQTGYDMVGSDGDDLLAGIAYMGAVCAKYSTISYATGMGEDMEACYQGVQTAAHEIAHNLGAPHDGEVDYGSGDCDWADGYMMSYEVGTVHTLFFSTCSITTMNNYLSSSEAICTTTNINNPSIATNFSSTSLPGTVLTMDQQCKCITGVTNAYCDQTVNPESKLCYNLVCKYTQGQFVYTLTSYAVAGEGSKCPSGKYCYNGACV